MNVLRYTNERLELEKNILISMDGMEKRVGHILHDFEVIRNGGEKR